MSSLSNQQETTHGFSLPFQTFGQWDPRTDVFRTMEVFYGRTTTKMIQKMFLLAEIQFLYWIDRGRIEEGNKPFIFLCVLFSSHHLLPLCRMGKAQKLIS